jgi:Sigma-70 region 2
MAAASRPGAARSDAELIHASRSDPAAFEVLVERHAMLLDRWLTAKTGSAALAHELMAETFAQAWRGARQFRGIGYRIDAHRLSPVIREAFAELTPEQIRHTYRERSLGALLLPRDRR